MSDELPPPPLRLRPRKRDDEAPATPPAAPLNVPEAQGTGIPSLPDGAPSAEPSPGRFRLKPKLTPVADEPAHTEAAVTEPAITPILRSESEDGASVARLKLKPTQPAASDPLVTALPEAPVDSAALIDAAPATTPALALGPDAGPPPVPQDQAERLNSPGAETPVAPLARPPLPGTLPAVEAKALKLKVAARNSRRLMLGLLGLLLVGGGAGGYFYLMQEEVPPPRPVAAKPASPPIVKRVETPAVAASVVEPVAAPVAPPPTVPVIESLPAAPTTALSETKPAIKPPKAPAAPVMTPAFRLWLEGVRINGVSATAGVAPRVIINGRLVRPGDTIDSAEAITFDSLDVERRMVMFRNRAGMVAGKPY